MKDKNDSSPRVDVIIPTYNYGCYLEQCLHSVLNQTFKNYVVLIIDNASEDNTQEIASQWVKKDARFTYVRNETNIGLLGSSRKSYALTRAELVLFLSADDLLEPLFLEKTVAVLDRHPECSFAYTAWRIFVDDIAQENHGVENAYFIPHDRSGCYQESGLLLTYNWITNSCCLFRRKVCDSVGGPNPADVYHVGDWYIWMRLAAKGPAYYVHESLARYRSHGKCETNRLNDAGLSGFGHLYLHDKIFESDLWSWPVRLMAKANQIRWLTGESIVDVARKMVQGNHPTIAQLINKFRNEFLVEIARCVLEYHVLNPNFLDTSENALMLLEEVLEQDPNNNEARVLINNFKSKQSINSKGPSYSQWFIAHSWTKHRCQRLLKSVQAPELIKSIHILLTVNYKGESQQLAILSDLINKLVANTIDDLTAQTLPNWRLTILSEHACPNPHFISSKMLEWIEISSTQQTDAIAAVVEASSAEWFICAPTGLRLSPAFTLLVGMRLLDRPNTLLLYTDEDLISTDGEHLQPTLKPDINLEFLRSSPYVGAATLIHKSLMLDPRIAMLPVGLTRNYGAALMATEQSVTSVGHLDEILVHVPEILADEYINTPLAKILLQQHLGRCKIDAEVSNGSIPDTFFIDYKLPNQLPKVSIIIPTKDRIDLLQPCIENLSEKTCYKNYEIIIVDNGSTDSATLKYLENLKIDENIKILNYSKEYNYSAINNFAARQATGDFLLLLNNDTVVLESDWLERMVAIGSCRDIGIVGCRLIFPNHRIQHAGVIIGMLGNADHVGIDLPMTDLGYMGRLQSTQDFSAVTAACLLVRKDLFFAAGGLDEIAFPILYNDVDLCLKIRKQGYRVVWTPHATLIHHGSVSLNSQGDTREQEKRIQKNLKSIKNFQKKWVIHQPRDPAYNRHLSLRERTWMIDGDFDVPWHPDLEPLPRIVAQPPDTTGVGQYRMIGPLKALTDSGRICSFLLPPINSEARFLPFPSELARVKPTVLFLQNAFSHWHIGEVESYAELLPDIFRVFGQDDIVFSVPQKSSVHKLFAKDTKARLRKVTSLCHRVIATSQPIADAMRGMVDDIRVMPNYLERSRWGDLQPPRKERRKLRVGWAGAQQHQGDLEFIIPVVEATANEVDWIFMGMSLTKLRYHIAELHGPVSFDEYPAGLAALDLDLAIAPLEINRFNAAKSNLRLLEYGAVGYPVICTDIEPYRNAPVTCVSNNPKAWIDAIHAHIHDMDATRAAGEQLHDWVLSNWMLDQHLDEWMMLLLPD